MFACWSAAAVWISRSNRSTLIPCASAGDSSLTTTFRRSAVSSATNTRDMPPPPSSRSSVYALPRVDCNCSRICEVTSEGGGRGETCGAIQMYGRDGPRPGRLSGTYVPVNERGQLVCSHSPPPLPTNRIVSNDDVLARLTTSLADRYRIERELGQGGMATVFLAHDLRHDRDVAIKVLHPDLGAALGAERFLAEIRTTARLQHPHILPLLDSGNAGALLYYVMPLVTGETLRARLARKRQLPIDDAIRISREIADALDYAHRQGVIHLDIKPENVSLHEGRPMVMDFGIALAVQQAGGQRMTQTGLSLGTPQYMSPEQAMGERSIDARSDIYALGAVLYEMLTGDPPFTGSTVQAIVAKVLTEKPAPLIARRERVTPAVEHAVLTALEKLPADRFASATDFANALSNSSFRSSAATVASTV